MFFLFAYYNIQSDLRRLISKLFKKTFIIPVWVATSLHLVLLTVPLVSLFIDCI